MHTDGQNNMKNKLKIRLGFTDYFNPVDEFFTDILSEDFDIERDDENPQYLIFCDENFGTNNRRFDGKIGRAHV